MKLKYFYLLFTILFSNSSGISQNTWDTKVLRKDPAYLQLKTNLLNSFYPDPRKKNISCVRQYLTLDSNTTSKSITLTFDLCGGKGGDQFDKKLIELLKKEKVPATIFISGLWLDTHPKLVKQLAQEPLFTIANHGLNHQPCSTQGKAKYHITGTANTSAAIDEIELNARKILALTGHWPRYYRPGTACGDSWCAQVAHALNQNLIGYDILLGDSESQTTLTQMIQKGKNSLFPGAILLLHANHPERFTAEALAQLIPYWRKQGWNFVPLSQFTPQNLVRSQNN